jgi:hypothetical protein
MDTMLFPDEALAMLREARYDPAACRGFNRPAGAFLWSDERLHQVRGICSDHGSRAEFYLLAYRSSLIQGEPIEEFRGPWEQLRQACPEWPGFRAERSSSHLARALARERTFARLLPDSVLILVAVLLAVPLLLLILAVPISVQQSALNLQRASHSAWFWIGLGVQVIGILFWEFLFKGWDRLSQVEAKWGAGGAKRGAIDVLVTKGVWVFGLQGFTLFLFRMLMDGGVRFRACCYVYLLYAVPALLLLALRWKAWTRVELLFLRWAWVPILTFGLPLLLPILIARGLVRVIW